MKDSKVFVIGITGKRLMPTTPQKARKLLKAGKAKVVSKRPFAIQLNYKSGSTTQHIDLGIDTGSQNIGIAVVSEDNALHKAEIQLRSTMEKKSLLAKRASYRRGRRCRKVRYRHPKYKIRTKRRYSKKLITRKSTKHKTHWVKETTVVDTGRQEGWLPPSIQSKIDQHFRWIDRYLAVLPEDTHLNIEVARFDIARMKDPDIRGELYQKGPQYDYENLKAYVFARDDYRCKCCGAKAGTISKKTGKVVKLVAHHIQFRSKGATDDPKYMASVCTDCHTTKAHQPGGILDKWREDNKEFARGYRDSAFMNILRKRIMERYPQARFTYGNITAADRKTLMLPKSHSNDAVAIAGRGISKLVSNCTTICYKQVRKKKRSLHDANPKKGRSAPNEEAKRSEKNTKAKKGFYLWDKVLVNGIVCWISGFSGDHSARVVDVNGHFIPVPGKKYTQHQLSTMKALSHNNNWISFSVNF